MRSKVFILFVVALIFVTSAFAQASEPVTANSAVNRFADSSVVEDAASQLIRFDSGVIVAGDPDDDKKLCPLWPYCQ